jgi:hypothetical protein
VLVCPRCHGALVSHRHLLRCSNGHVWPVDDGIADFAEGNYYDRFDPASDLRAGHAEGLELELEGTRRRIVDFYAPMIPPRSRVLDCGCGNGLSVDLLNDAGFDVGERSVRAAEVAVARAAATRPARRRERVVAAVSR